MHDQIDYMRIADFLDENWDAFVAFYDDEDAAQEQVDALRAKAMGK